MAAAVVLAGQVPRSADCHSQVFTFDTASGPQKIELLQEGAQAIWTTDAPKVLVNREKLAWRTGNPASISIVDSGLPYLVVDADQLGISQDDSPALAEAAVKLSAEAARQLPMEELGISGSYNRYLIMFQGRMTSDHVRVTWVSSTGEVATLCRGTGALAVLAACQKSRALPLENSVRIQALGGSFQCRISGNSATVSAKTRIAAHHTFLRVRKDG